MYTISRNFTPVKLLKVVNMCGYIGVVSALSPVQVVRVVKEIRGRVSLEGGEELVLC